MKTKILQLTMFALTITMFVYGQSTMELTFTGDNNGEYLLMDSIYAKNLTQGLATTLPQGDTILILHITSLSSPESWKSESFSIGQNSPNPFDGVTTFEISIPKDGLVTFEISNISGVVKFFLQKNLSQGIHSFSFRAGNDLVYLLTINFESVSRTIKLLNTGRTGQACNLQQNGSSNFQPPQKYGSLSGNLNYIPGDELLIVGYYNGEEAGFVHSPEAGRGYITQFATNASCPGIDSVFYESKWYHTIQVFGQCWLKENLNVGTMVNGNQQQTNNGVIERYCYANSANICATDGALYLWEEIMQYTTEPGARGICPEGWHIPTDAEAKVLEGAADTFYKIGAAVWNNTGYRGFDAGKNLKCQTGWSAGGSGADLYGFKLLPTGYWYDGYFDERTVDGGFWTSSLNNGTYPFSRGMNGLANGVARVAFNEPVGFPVRCIKDL